MSRNIQQYDAHAEQTHRPVCFKLFQYVEKVISLGENVSFISAILLTKILVSFNFHLQVRGKMLELSKTFLGFNV